MALFVTAVEFDGKRNACITNTLMQQSHTPVKLSLTIMKKNLTHDLVKSKGSVAVSILSDQVDAGLIRHFGFASGRDTDKFSDFPHALDQNGNPVLSGLQIAASVSMNVYDSIDMGTHTMFLCEPVNMAAYEGEAITYAQYQSSLKKKSQ